MRPLSLLLLLLLGSAISGRADVAVLTQHNDLSRTGDNLHEVQLNTGNVNSNQFGLLYSRPVDDQIYAQPLIVTNVNIPGYGVHNIAIVTTVNDSVYAFDADNAGVTQPYWHVMLADTNNNFFPVHNTDMTGACGGDYQDFSGNIGIVGTPVVDATNGTVFLVARVVSRVPPVIEGSFRQYLHALDITTGAERSNSPAWIQTVVPGTGEGGSVVYFDPQKENQRPALALAGGLVYMAWASHCDWDNYHGWIMAYDETNLLQRIVYNTTPNGEEGGIWMSGQAPAIDSSGNLYVSVGNGTVGDSDPRSITNRGESFLKLTPTGTNLTVASWFTPYNYSYLDFEDLDLGSCGMMLIPGTTRAVAGSKEGKLYLMNRDSMGGLSYTNADTNMLEIIQVTSPTGPNNNIHGGIVWWTGTNGSFVYVQGESDYLKQYQFNPTNQLLATNFYAESPTTAPYGMPGGILSVSGNGTNAGSGIIWVSHQYTGDANQQVRPGILHAYDAANVSHELWNSEQVHARDTVGNFAKFVPPTIANGKVYLATFSGQLNVYGLLPTLSVKPGHGSATLAWSTNSSLVYGVQTCSNLVSANWQTLTTPLTTNNGFYQITVLVTNRTAFYRLKSN